MTLILNLAFTELQEVSMEHLQRVWHASSEHLPVRTPGSVPFWDLLMLELLRPVFTNLPLILSTLHLEYPSVHSRFRFDPKYSSVTPI